MKHKVEKITRKETEWMRYCPLLKWKVGASRIEINFPYGSTHMGDENIDMGYTIWVSINTLIIYKSWPYVTNQDVYPWWNCQSEQRTVCHVLHSRKHPVVGFPKITAKHMSIFKRPYKLL